MNLFKDTRRRSASLSRKVGKRRSFRWRGGSRGGGSRMEYPERIFSGGSDLSISLQSFPQQLPLLAHRSVPQKPTADSASTRVAVTSIPSVLSDFAFTGAAMSSPDG